MRTRSVSANSRYVPLSVHLFTHQCVTFHRHFRGSSLDCCCIEQLQLNETSMWLAPPPTLPHSTFDRTPQCRSFESTDQPRACHVQYDRPVANLALFTSLNQIYDVVKHGIANTVSDRMDLPQPEVVCKRPGGMPLKAYDSVKVMLITIVLFLTVSSCQTLYSVIESPQRPHLFESRNKAIASPNDATPYQSRVQPIAYMPTHINQRPSLPLVRYQHANRLRKRPRRSNKSSPSRESSSLSKQLFSLSASNARSNSAVSSSTVQDKPSQPSPSSFFVPSSLLSFSPMLSSSILATQMKPPYVSGSSSIHSSQASANQMETQQSPLKNITAQVGHPVYLHCIVESLGDKMVSWIRLRDFHLLTIGSLTYIQDDRFAVRPTSHSTNDWSLQIKHVSVKDEGLYECQINSDPPRSQYYYLHVVVPVSEIAGNPDIFVRSGAPINLTCLISSSPEPPAFVFWYHNNRMINYDYNSDSKGQISVQKDPTKSDVVISRLLIKKAKLDDSGNYTCSPSNAEPASSYVHVLQGEKRMSNQIQNDWSQPDQLSNEGHHSSQDSRFQLTTWALNVQMAALLYSSVVCLSAR